MYMYKHLHVHCFSLYICREFAKVNAKTGTPLLATIVTGVLSALMSLFVGLAVLVELMSIGKPS